MTRPWRIFKNFLTHLFHGGEDRIAMSEHGKELPLEEAERRQREEEKGAQ